MRSALKEFIEALPEPFNMVDIEARVKEKSPYVVVALQEVCAGDGGEQRGRGRAWEVCGKQATPTLHLLCSCLR